MEGKGGYRWGSDLSFYVSALDFIFDTVEGELASEELKELPLEIFLEYRVGSREDSSPVGHIWLWQLLMARS